LFGLTLLCVVSCDPNVDNLLAQDRMPSTRYEAIAWLEASRNTVTKNDSGEVTEIIIDYVPDIFVVGDLGLFPKLELVKINYTGQFYDRHMSGIARLKSLKVFEVDYCDEISEASISVLRYLPNLEEVKLKDCEAVYSLKSLVECKSLKKVDLSSNDHLDFEVLKSLRRLPKLESLVLDENSNLEDKHLRWLKGLKTLTELSLVECSSLTDDAFEQLAGVPNLKKLVIRDNDHITGASIGEMKGGALEKLDLRNCALSDESLANFKHLKSLRKFMFSENDQIEGTGLAVLRNFKQLEELHLSGLSVSNQQLKSRLGGCKRVDSDDLVEVAKFKNLGVLDLRGTKVKPDGIEVLAQLKSLKEIDLSSCNWIDDSAMLKLASFPALKRIRLDKVLRLTDKAFENLGKSKTIKTISLSKMAIKCLFNFISKSSRNCQPRGWRVLGGLRLSKIFALKTTRSFGREHILWLCAVYRKSSRSGSVRFPSLTKTFIRTWLIHCRCTTSPTKTSFLKKAKSSFAGICVGS